MLYSCITGSARKEIVLFHPTGLAFKNYGTGDFLQKCWKGSHKKNMRKARNRNTWIGNKKVVKIPMNIIPTTKGYRYKHTLQASGAWYDFKDEMLVGLYDAGFSKHACSLCLRSWKRKTRLRSRSLQLSRDIKEITTTYTDSFETAENRKRAD